MQDFYKMGKFMSFHSRTTEADKTQTLLMLPVNSWINISLQDQQKLSSLKNKCLAYKASPITAPPKCTYSSVPLNPQRLCILQSLYSSVPHKLQRSPQENGMVILFPWGKPSNYTMVLLCASRTSQFHLSPFQVLLLPPMLSPSSGRYLKLMRDSVLTGSKPLGMFVMAYLWYQAPAVHWYCQCGIAQNRALRHQLQCIKVTCSVTQCINIPLV